MEVESMCYRVHAFSKSSGRERTQEHVLERPTTGPVAVGEHGLVAVARSWLHRLMHKRSASTRKPEVAEI